MVARKVHYIKKNIPNQIKNEFQDHIMKKTTQYGSNHKFYDDKDWSHPKRECELIILQLISSTI